jgi:Fucose 4-O-acetylase and related acetyltransferases
MENVPASAKAVPPVSSKTIASARSSWPDYAKGMAMIFLVLGHVRTGFEKVQYQGQPLGVSQVMEMISQVLYLANVPLFFVISGLYLRNSLMKRGAPHFIGNKFNTILYPYLVWGTIQLAFQYVGYRLHMSNTPRQATDWFNLLYNPRPLDQFWFLYVLFFISVFYSLLVYYARLTKTALLIIATLAYIAYYYLPDQFFILGIKQITKFFFYLVLGDIASRWLLDEANVKRFSAVWVIMLILLAFTGVKLAMQGEAENNFFSLQNLLVLLAIFIGMSFTISLSYLLQRLKATRWLSVVGKNTMYIYCMHIIIAGISRALLLKATNYQYPNSCIIIVTIISVGLPIALIPVFQRWGFWFLFSPVRPENKTAKPLV